MKPEFTKGDTAYTIAGGEVEVVGMLDGKYLVYHVYEEFWGDESAYHADTSVIHSYDTIYASPPVEVQNKEIQKLEEVISNKRKELAELEVKIITTKKDHTALLANLKKTDALQYIDDIIEGRITHIVEVSFRSVRIHEFDEFIRTRYRHDKGLRLLSLYGASKGDLQFKVNEYTDGSGSDTEVYPAPSKEIADALAKKLLIDIVKDTEKQITEKGSSYIGADMLKSMTDLGIPSDIIQEYHNAALRKAIEDKVATLTAQLEQQQQLLGEL